MRSLLVLKAPNEYLRLESSRILPRLRLILEFKPWLEYTRLYFRRKSEAPVAILWDCFTLGASLCTLLDLLGSPSPRDLVVDVVNFDFGLSVAHREKFFNSFITRVQLLELQGRLPYGEVLRSEDLFDCTNSGFAKVRVESRRPHRSLIYPM